MGLVRAAYSAGKPAYGVGPGNAPCYIESSADVRKAADDILTGKSFDGGVLCSSPNSVVVDEAIEGETRRQFQAQGGFFLSPGQADALAKLLVTPQRLPNPALVGKPATYIAEKLGLTVPAGTRALIAELKGVGREHPLSIEKLCPVLSYYIVRDWREGCERCKQILRYGGMGHTMSIHSQNDQVILEFGLHKPAYRIIVNSPSTHGSIGLTTGLDPAMTLGCGGSGGNITSDNISPKHLLNIKRLAYELRPAKSTQPQAQVPMVHTVPEVPGLVPGVPGVPGAPPLPKAPAVPQPDNIGADALANRIDRFLATRGLAAPGTHPLAPQAPYARQAPESVPVPAVPEQFVCEDDVRIAVKEGRKLLIGDRTIVTPAARDAGEAGKVFVYAGWPT
jgi:acetaldehyde dehydrogenase (acetylating)